MIDSGLALVSDRVAAPGGGGLESFSSASFAYPKATNATRAQIAERLGPIDKVYRRLKALGIEAFVMVTCLRFELLVSGSVSLLNEALEELFGEQSGTEEATVRTGVEAVEHIIRVASGLETPLIGEQEIFVQFRSASTEWTHNATAGSKLGSLLEAATSTARTVRKLIGVEPQGSMASLAVNAVGAAERVAVFGHGKMGKAVVEALLNLPSPPELTVLVRDPSKVSRPGVDVRGLGEVVSILGSVQAVISATSASDQLATEAEVTQALRSRSQALTLVDMAMPPDFDRPIGELATYINIDDLAERESNQLVTAELDQVVSEAAAEFMKRAETNERAGILIEQLFKQADFDMAAVARRFAGKLTAPEDQELLDQALRAAARKLLHNPVSFIAGEGAEDSQVVAAAFGVEFDG